MCQGFLLGDKTSLSIGMRYLRHVTNYITHQYVQFFHYIALLAEVTIEYREAVTEPSKLSRWMCTFVLDR